MIAHTSTLTDKSMGAGGTGRGTLLNTVFAGLFGDANCMLTLTPQHLIPSTSESTYTAWQTESLIASVSEAATDDSLGSKEKDKAAAFFRQVYEPGEGYKARVRKMRTDEGTERATAWLIMASNNLMPVTIDPQAERRIWAVYNQRTSAEQQGVLRKACTNPLFLAALADDLKARACDTRGAYESPPTTGAKEIMLERSDRGVSRILDETLDDERLLPGSIASVDMIVAAFDRKRLQPNQQHGIMEHITTGQRGFVSDEAFNRTRVGSGDGVPHKEYLNRARMILAGQSYNFRVIQGRDNTERMMELIAMKRKNGSAAQTEIKAELQKNLTPLVEKPIGNVMPFAAKTDKKT